MDSIFFSSSNAASTALFFPLSSLQIDAVSLFLLYLVEMICSGLQIIYNTDEVNTENTLKVVSFKSCS